MGVETVLSRGLDGLTVNLRALGTTSNNVANANTPGYARQTLTIASNPADPTSPGNGGGASVISLQSIMDPFIEMQLSQTANAFGTQDGRQNTVAQVESLWNESETSGIGKGMQDFFASVQVLTQDPSNPTARGSVQQKAVQLATQFNTMSTSFNQMRTDLSNNIQTKINTINQMTQVIAGYNQTIILSGGASASPDLVAQRQAAIKDLSQEMGITYYQAQNGAVEIQTTSGAPLISDFQAGTLSTTNNANTGGKVAVICQLPGSSDQVDITAGVTTGRLGGQIYDRNTNLNNQIAGIDNLAYALTQQVNAIHSTGYGSDGSTGNNMFTPLSTATGASGFISVDQGVLNNIAKISAAQSPTSGPGDAKIAVKLAQLQETPVMNSNTQTLAQNYQTLIGSVGLDASNVKTNLDNEKYALTQVQIQRESISGVNMDEEGANIIRYQKAFQASSKIISIADELIDDVLKI